MKASFTGLAAPTWGWQAEPQGNSCRLAEMWRWYDDRPQTLTQCIVHIAVLLRLACVFQPATNGRR